MGLRSREAGVRLRDSIGVFASLEKMKGDFDRDLDPDGVTILHGRFKFPGFHGVDGIFVEPHAKAVQHADMAGMTVRFHYQAKRADSLKMSFAGFVTVLGLR